MTTQGSSDQWWHDRAGLDGTVAIVTGGAGGLGEAITLDLCANGVRVALVDRDVDAVARIGKRLAADGRDAVVHTGDAREPDVLDALFDAATQRWGRLDGVVNVVGGTFRGAFTDQSPRAWDALIRTNLTHVLHSTSRAIPLMRAGGRGGSIVNITTIEATRAAPNFAVYSAAKAAVVQFARTMAVELAPDRIRVNCVAPDLAPTPNMLGISPDTQEHAAADGAVHALLDPLNVGVSIPMARLGTPGDISNSVVFLLSGLSSYITGTTLRPDGGTWASSGWFNWPEVGFGNTLPPSVLHMLHDREAAATTADAADG
ncbi:MAG: 2-dehydro-3-deoxy-D-gluconate 5-dehydrogenase [Actinomycetota bacterium]